MVRLRSLHKFDWLPYISNILDPRFDILFACLSPFYRLTRIPPLLHQWTTLSTLGLVPPCPTTIHFVPASIVLRLYQRWLPPPVLYMRLQARRGSRANSSLNNPSCGHRPSPRRAAQRMHQGLPGWVFMSIPRRKEHICLTSHFSVASPSPSKPHLLISSFPSFSQLSFLLLY